ncbi:methenyltetrahydrofolate synthase domain-containing protein-like isoform X2 [Stegodyphus dumicola]|uniref:methenyltetrahydrofolate synthase domain-containing protein-like isoform X2 n=1 Tax=Stegodyphus dumicola TaxID=202533 RepID=UPI0015AEC4E9|nr:methenyltetrahydrofolate synthase domain-containing protein-like isoform X2 [Stegodyphus dumicola]
MSSTLQTKEAFRQRVWSYMEEKNIALFPRPVYNRIPNFQGAYEACNKVKQLREFQASNTIKANKTLLVPTPRLIKGLFNKITPPPNSSKHILRMCSTSEGLKHHSVKIGLNSKIKVDLVIIGSVAVSIKGHRIGKGEGYADMEFAMMATMGAVNSNTTVITTVHDCQVFESLPDELFGEHDVPVDIIVTPTKVIYCEPRLPKPSHIIWSLLTEEKINKIPILKILREMEEKQKTES